ncbi:MAG: hypothetical protein M3Q15_03680 [Pseudomonadota bacterium]|nr:hypothetical protein [Pseudomonadota bacterium]
MDMGGGSWGIITIVGPLLLIAAIAWAALRNRKRPDTKGDTERGTRDLYREEERAHRGEDDDVP